MNTQVSIEHRIELEKKINQVFSSKIKELSTELQRILIDDLVTAFENRLKVLKMVNIVNGF